MDNNESGIACPRCKTVTDRLVPIDTALRVGLKEAGEDQGLPDHVCQTCYQNLANSISQGLKLRMERDQREKNKMMAWKGRVNLIKSARQMMEQKAYAQAAVQYEKYLRVLEVAYSLKKGELSPDVFNNSSRSKEMTVIASVYWDLVRIYDTSPQYRDRMARAADKLSKFLPFSSIYPDVMKKADSFVRSAKNPVIVRQFLKASRAGRGKCFVASAAFAEQPHAVELFWLRRYRDEVLRKTPLGRQLIRVYYRSSPPLAKWIGSSQLKSRLARRLITKITEHLKKNLKSA